MKKPDWQVESLNRGHFVASKATEKGEQIILFSQESGNSMKKVAKATNIESPRRRSAGN